MHCATGKTRNMDADCQLAELVPPSLATLASAYSIALQMSCVQPGVRTRPLVTDSLPQTVQLAGILRLQDILSLCRMCSDLPCGC